MASYDITTSTFTPLTNAASTSTLLGPVTAFTSANTAYTTFFAAGVSSDTNSPFISQYNGSTWNPISSDTSLGPGTLISGLQVLSLTQAHAAAPSSILSTTQTLLLTGQLELPGFGNVSAALYNGTTFTPFILSSLADGSPGTLRSAFVANPQNLLSSRCMFLPTVFFSIVYISPLTIETIAHQLALGFIVLIALAIALALLFLLVVAGIFAERMRRRREGYVPAPTSMAPMQPVSEKKQMQLMHGGGSGGSYGGTNIKTTSNTAPQIGEIGLYEEKEPGPGQTRENIPARLKFDFI